MKWISVKIKPNKFVNVLGLSKHPKFVLRISNTCIQANGEFDNFMLDPLVEEKFIARQPYPELPNEKQLNELLKF